jgi:peptidoglycan/LPS O-acetylase OafA/YrhL
VKASAELPNLDILRAIAVLLVVIDHTSKFFGADPTKYHLDTLGGTGVMLFFVHTCLVLMFSLERQGPSAMPSFLGRFYIRRAFRIYPLSIFFVLLVSVFSIPQDHIAGPFQLALTPFDPRTLASNLALAMNVTGHAPILGQLWSLPYEVQMYLLLPFGFLLARRFGTPAILLAWVCAAALATVPRVSSLPGVWRLSLLEFTPCFIPGILAFSLWGTRRRFPSVLWIPTILALGIPYWWTASRPVSWVMCLAVGALIPLFYQAQTAWLIRSAHLIAKYSYGVYLGHVLALWVGFLWIKAAVPVQIAAWLVALVVIPVASYHLLERPLIGLGNRLTRTRSLSA